MGRALLLSFFSAVLCGQTFEVASVKPAKPEQSIVDFQVLPGGRLRIVNLTLAEIVRSAYRMKFFQTAGGPAWMQSDRFNIEATASGELDREAMMAALRALLADRFHLQVRREAREGNVYELIVAKNGPKLKDSTAASTRVRLIRNTPPQLPGVSYTIDGEKATMARFAEELIGPTQHMVVDRTGLTGEYDFKVDYALEGHNEEGPSIFTALPEQLGLRLQAAKAPVETLVILNAEKPTAN